MYKLVAVFCVLTILVATNSSSLFAQGSNFQQEIYGITECNDGIDNDDDGAIDFAFDEDCVGWSDDSESNEGEVPVDTPTTPEPQPEPTDDSQAPQSSVTAVQTEPAVTESIAEIREVEYRIIKFLWKPLGQVLGISEAELLNDGIVKTSTNKAATLISSSLFVPIVVLYSLIMIILIILVVRDLTEKIKREKKS